MFERDSYESSTSLLSAVLVSRFSGFLAAIIYNFYRDKNTALLLYYMLDLNLDFFAR